MMRRRNEESCGLDVTDAGPPFAGTWKDEHEDRGPSRTANPQSEPMIRGVTDGEALPVLERMVQFTARRHRLITNNIANLSTPGYRPADLSVEAFQKQLGEAIDHRRAAERDGGHQPLPPTELDAETAGHNLLFHDQNDRDVDRTMQSLVENFMSFRMASQLMRNHLELINTAIRERI